MAEEMDVEERASAAAHVNECPACAGRLESWREAADRLDVALSDLPAAAPDPVRRAASLAAVRHAAASKAAERKHSTRFRPRWAPLAPLARAAAVAGVLVAGSAMVVTATPVGHWMAGLLGRLAGVPAPAVVQSDTAAAGARALATTGAIVAFRPSGDAMEVEVLARQEGATLTFRLSDAPTVSARVRGGDGEADMMVLPTALTIDNRKRAAAAYEVTVPARLERLRVRVAGEQVLDVRPVDLGADWSAVVDMGGRPDATGTTDRK